MCLSPLFEFHVVYAPSYLGIPVDPAQVDAVLLAATVFGVCQEQLIPFVPGYGPGLSPEAGLVASPEELPSDPSLLGCL